MVNTTHTPINLKQYDGFLNPEHCKKIIELGEPSLAKAEILGEQKEDFRIAETTFFDPNLRTLMKIREVIAKQTGLPMENQEAMSIIRYNVGGVFKPHHDCFHSSADYYPAVMATGGQRLKTCLIYLNEEFEGGMTEFPLLGIKVQPKTGKLIMWDNANSNGEIINESLHSGLPVTAGMKYVLTIWIRERAFTGGEVTYH